MPLSLERRRTPRRTVRRTDHIRIAGSPPRDCLVTDISDGGVRLFAAGFEVPDRFGLLLLDFEGRTTLRDCQVVWRHEFNLGAKFIDAMAEGKPSHGSVREPTGA